MIRRRLAHLAVAHAIVFAGGCAKELDLDSEPADPTRSVIAQFDPTSDIPVLRLTPTPTALAENPDGTLNHEAVRPPACALPTRAQCLVLESGGQKIVNAWPTTTKPTLFFSTLFDDDGTDTGEIFLENAQGEADEANIKQGIKLWEVQPDGSLKSIDYTPVIELREEINPACQSGDNGSNPPQTYGPEDVPPGRQLVLNPKQPLKPATEYIVSVESFGDSGGVRDVNGNPIEPSSLFYLLNSDDQEIGDDGTIYNELLRGEVTSSVIEQLKRITQEEPTPEQIQAATSSSGLQLRGLERFFDAVTAKLLNSPLAAGETTPRVEKRENLVFANFWHTGPAPQPEVAFDPLNSILPFPNNQLLTVPSSSVAGGLLVNLPIDDSDSPSTKQLLMNFNQLNGFSTTGDIIIPVTADLNPASLVNNVLMYPVDANGMVDGPSVELEVRTTTATALAPASIFVRPKNPLQQDKNYVFAIKRGVTDANGKPVGANSTYELLKYPAPFITGGEVTDPYVEQVLQCRPVAAGATRLATDDEVQATAQLLEIPQGLNHQGWLRAFEALERIDTRYGTPISRLGVIWAMNYKTQSIVDDVDRVENELLPSAWPDLQLQPLIQVDTSTQVRAFLDIPTNVCLPLCETGALIGIAPNQCRMVPIATIGQHPVCQAVVEQLTSDLSFAGLYLLRTFRLTRGSPFATGTFRPLDQMPDVVPVPVLVLGKKPSPGGKAPIVVFGHGLGASKESILTVANTFAREGAEFMMVAMDMPFHGDRVSDLVLNDQPGAPPCGLVPGTSFIDPSQVVCSGDPLVCQGGCDGKPDPSATGFLSPNFFSVRDNFRQAVIDQLTLIKTLQQEGQAEGAAPMLDGARIAYVGQSLGSIVGGSLAAYAGDDLETLVLNAGGGGLFEILERTVPTISAPLWRGLAGATNVCELKNADRPELGCQDTAAFRQFRQLAQWALDPGDPLANAIGVAGPVRPGRPFLGTDKILMQIAVPDLVVSDANGRDLAEAYGFDENERNLQLYDFTYLGAQATSGTGCHAWFAAPVCGACFQDVLCNTFGAQGQAVRYVASQGAAISGPREVPGVDCSNPCL